MVMRSSSIISEMLQYDLDMTYEVLNAYAAYKPEQMLA